MENKPFEEGVGALALWAIGATTSPATTGPTVGDRVLPATVEGRRQAFEQNMQTVMRFFTRPHRLSAIRAQQADGSVRRALVEWKEWSEPEVQAGGTRAEWGISYIIPGVWWEDETVTTQTSVAAASLATLDLTQFSGMTGIIDDAVITVFGPITNPKIQDMETGQWVQYSGTVAAGQSWVIDCGAFTSMVGVSSVLANTKHGGGYRFLTIPNCYGLSNTPRIAMTQGTSLGATTALRVSARRKWVHG